MKLLFVILILIGICLAEETNLGRNSHDEKEEKHYNPWPSRHELREHLTSIVSQANGGFGFNMWVCYRILIPLYKQ
jgi:hypothetical protein